MIMINVGEGEAISDMYERYTYQINMVREVEGAQCGENCRLCSGRRLREIRRPKLLTVNIYLLSVCM